jgi:hypothetical protein
MIISLNWQMITIYIAVYELHMKGISIRELIDLATTNQLSWSEKERDEKFKKGFLVEN